MKNKIMIDQEVTCVQRNELGSKNIALLNQVKIYKRMKLPCKLVRFQDENKTKEKRKYRESSCIIQKFDTEVVPKLSRKLYEMQNDFVDWLII